MAARLRGQENQVRFLQTPLSLRVAAISAATALLFLSSGCGEAIQNSGEDNSFIRQYGDPAASKLKLKSGPLLPTKTGNVWRNLVTVRRLAGPSNGNLDPNVDDKGNPFPKTFENGTSKTFLSPNGGNGSEVRIGMQQENVSKSNRVEVYTVNKRGIFLSRVEGEVSMTALPPLPIISYPVQENEIKSWSGTVRVANKTYPGQGYSRVSSPEEINLPQGKVLACRVDTILITTVDGRSTSFPMKRWFAPGIGMVRQKFISGNLEVTKDLVRYKI